MYTATDMPYAASAVLYYTSNCFIKNYNSSQTIPIASRAADGFPKSCQVNRYSWIPGTCLIVWHKILYILQYIQTTSLLPISVKNSPCSHSVHSGP